ncbi:MAG: hypothetical protein V2I26_06840 [Halieaceae bacterium]|jgi:hypothetical protein|nr:hypothetical protein [Halieaceae bacterium]
MKLSEATVKAGENYFELVEIRRNPAEIAEFITWLYGGDGKSFMLCGEDDAVLSSRSIDLLISTLKEAGFKKAKIYF